MARGNRPHKSRIITPDPVYKSVLLHKFINNVMIDGKKSVAQKQVYKALQIIQSKEKDPLQTFNLAIDNASPQMEVRSRRIGGAAYQVPVSVSGVRKTSLAFRWIIEGTRKRGNSEYKTFANKLAAELLDAANNEGEAVKKKEATHKMAEANKAFSHFRW
jgi:small subunit ribosomal protein S7